jgi:hypothetical protein
MTAKETFEYLINGAGLDEETAKIVMKAADNQKVQERAAALKAQSEYDAIVAQKNALDASYAKAKTYEDWYAKNGERVNALQNAYARYVERFGELDATHQAQQTQQPQAKQFTQEDIDKMVEAKANAVIQQNYGPRWSQLLKGSGRIIEQHLRAKRESLIDWDKIGELAEKKGGDIVAAYDEYDAPERQKYEAKQREDEISRRVKEELQKRGAQQYFPGSPDSNTPSPLARAKDDKFDKYKLENSLVDTFLKGGDSSSGGAADFFKN